MATSEDSALRVASLGEERGDEVAALLARAFHGDPLFVYACPGADFMPHCCAIVRRVARCTR